jgi:hypothetical protein
MEYLNKEFKGVVVDNVDPEGKSRLKVFLLGYHDATGTRTKIDDLKWVFCRASSPVITSIPKIGQIVNVYYVNTPFHTFGPMDGGFWTPASHYTRNDSAITGILPFLVFDTESKKFINTINQGYDKKSELNDYKIRKTELEGNLENLKNEEKFIIEETPKRLEALIKNEEIEVKKRKQIFDDIKKTNEIRITQKRDEAKKLGQEFADDAAKNFSAYYEENYKQKYGDEDDLSTNNNATYQSLLREYAKIRGYEDRRNGINQDIIFYNNQTLGEEQLYNEFVSASNQKIDSFPEQELKKNQGLQSQIDKVSLELEDVNAKIRNLESSSTSADKATDTGGKVSQASTNQNIKTEYDAKTGILYGYIEGENGQLRKLVIGNWTGSYMYHPGFFGQDGTPIYKRMSGDLYKQIPYIKETSFLPASDPHAAERGDTTANHPVQNPGTKKSDNDKKWNCDLSTSTKGKILAKRKNVMMAVKWLRDKIAALFTSASNSAIGQWVKASVNQLTALLKSTQRFLRFVNEVVVEITKIVNDIRLRIQWILSLPARLLALLQECITHFLKDISEILSESIPGISSDGSSVSFTEIKELVTQAQSTFNTAMETVQVTTILYTEIKTVEATFEKV